MAKTSSKTFSFDLILARQDQITVELADALFEAGADDSSPSSSGGVVTVHFDREARSLTEAVGSAIANVEQAGSSVSRIIVGEEQRGHSLSHNAGVWAEDTVQR